jgi:hypothetical protein
MSGAAAEVNPFRDDPIGEFDRVVDSTGLAVDGLRSGCSENPCRQGIDESGIV